MSKPDTDLARRAISSITEKAALLAYSADITACLTPIAIGSTSMPLSINLLASHFNASGRTSKSAVESGH
jgi:hypothetical protein